MTGNAPSWLITPSANQLPAGASCQAWEELPDQGAGLPANYHWLSPSYSQAVTITAGQTAVFQVTNAAKIFATSLRWTKSDPTGPKIPLTGASGSFTLLAGGIAIAGLGLAAGLWGRRESQR